MDKKTTIILILVILVLGTIIYYLNFSVYKFKVVFLSAGNADSSIITYKDTTIVIDTAEEDFYDKLDNYLYVNKINKIDYLIITHFDKDHVGSASSIIDNIEIGEVLQSNSPKESEYYTNYLNSLASKSITPKTVTGNYNLTFEDLNIIVNGPETTYQNSESNNSSLIVSITYGNNKFLFMGDSENARIKDFISTNNETYDFIKIPYHGNYLKRLDDLLEKTNPKYGVMTCSQSEGCEKETLAILNNYNIKYYMTKNGSISVLSNGKNIQIKQ